MTTGESEASMIPGSHHRSKSEDHRGGGGWQERRKRLIVMTRGVKVLGEVLATSRRWVVSGCLPPWRAAESGANAAATNLQVHYNTCSNSNSDRNSDKSHRPASTYSHPPFLGSLNHRSFSTRNESDVQRWVPPGRWSGPPRSRPRDNNDEEIVDQYQKVMLVPHKSIFYPPLSLSLSIMDELRAVKDPDRSSSSPSQIEYELREWPLRPMPVKLETALKTKLASPSFALDDELLYRLANRCSDAARHIKTKQNKQNK